MVRVANLVRHDGRGRVALVASTTEATTRRGRSRCERLRITIRIVFVGCVANLLEGMTRGRLIMLSLVILIRFFCLRTGHAIVVVAMGVAGVASS